MKRETMKRAAALALAVAVLGGSASALFGKKQAEAEEGAPTVREVSITTYRGIPVQGQLLGSEDTFQFVFGIQNRNGVFAVFFDAIDTFINDLGGIYIRIGSHDDIFQ